jgi:hypothetical protein
MSRHVRFRTAGEGKWNHPMFKLYARFSEFIAVRGSQRKCLRVSQVTFSTVSTAILSLGSLTQRQA